MAFVPCDGSRTWVGQDGLVHCPQLVRIVTTDEPYLLFDFTHVLSENVSISTADAVIEKDSKTITVADTSVSDENRRVSFKVSGMSAGDFIMRSTVTLSDGTDNKISLQGTLRVS